MERLLELQAIFDDPPVNGGVIHLNPTFLHECFDVARARWIRHIPADACQNNILWKVGSLEAHGHGLSPSVFTLNHQGRSSLKWPQMNIATEPYNFCLPHASLRHPLRIPEPTNGSGSAKVWRPCTPAMATGLTDHVWSLKEVLLFRVPPWPQPQMV
jgi:hypothetical protein